jgi:hypothetical protein
MNIGILNRQATSSESSRSRISSSGRQSFPSADNTYKLRAKHPRLNLDGHKMAVVNLEAALATWKSFENNQVLKLSEKYRTKISSSTRVQPSTVGTFPRNLMNALYSTESRF